MMNTPSMYSVEQLLKARQDGIPDYVVVPMLQKAMAQKQAMAQQQALQQGMNPPPPVADQILDAAHNDVMQEHMARQVEEHPEPRGIDSLPSGIDEEDYAGGGIIAFAKGGGVDDYPEFDTSPYTGQYTDEEKNPEVLTEQFKKRMGEDPGVAKQEARIGEREASLKSEEDKAPWVALMQAGLATMAGTSPNAFANIGAGATKGLESYGESKKNLSARADKLDDLRSKIEESQRAEALAAVKYGSESAEARRLSDHTDKLKGAAAQLAYNENVAKHGIEVEKLGVEKQKAADDASYHQGYLGYLKSKGDAANSGDGLTAAQARELKGIDGDIKLYESRLENDMRPGAQEHYTKILDKLYNDRRAVEGKPAIEGFTPPAKPVEKRSGMGNLLHSMNPFADDEPAPAGKLPVNPKTGNFVYTR